MLFAQAVFAFVALPGIVAIAIPLWLAPAGGSFNVWGLLPLATGFVLLLCCVRDFYVAGKGTLAPWTPPRHLVQVGLYRFSRNPMYVAVLLMLVGWAIGFRTRSLWSYALMMAVVFYLRVVFFEEPWLARTHGEDFARYKASVPRWLVV